MTDEQRRQLDEQGFIVFPKLMGEEFRLELLKRVEELYESEGENAGHEFRTEPHARRLANLIDKGEVFHRVVMCPEVLDAARHVLGDGFKLSSLNARSTNPFAPESQPLHCDMGLTPDTHGAKVFNSVWMLDEFTAANGATRAVPGSHKWNELPSARMEDPSKPHPDEILVTGKAGTVVVYNAHLWHGGTANSTSRHRRALHAFYVRRDVPQQQYQKRLLGEETQRGLGAELRRLLALDDELNDRLSSAQEGLSGFMQRSPRV